MSIHFNDFFRYVPDTDVPIPTHYFVVLTSCKNNAYTPDSCSESLDVLPFIIPHRPTNVESCPVSVPGRTGVQEIILTSVSAGLPQKQLYEHML